MIEQVIGEMSARGVPFHTYYFRTSDQYELDLVLNIGNELWAIEVKLTSSPAPADLDRLNRTADMIHATRRFLVTRTSKPVGDEHRASCNLASLVETLRHIIAGKNTR